MLRDEPPSEDERDQCITAEPCEPCSVCARLITVTQKGFTQTVFTGQEISVNAVLLRNNRHPQQSLKYDNPVLYFIYSLVFPRLI